MNRWVLLLRGVNVGGHGKLPMADLRALLKQLGLGNVATYIQSGNAVFTGIIDADGMEGLLQDEIETHFGFRPQVTILSSESFFRIRADFPFPDAAPKTGHVWFLATPPAPDAAEKLHPLASTSEHFALTERALYLHAPDGIGRSKFAAGAEKLLGTPATARNLNTVEKLAEMLEKLPRE